MTSELTPIKGALSEVGAPPRTASRPRPLVVVADDHGDTRDLLRHLLEGWGCSVVEARDGVEAVEVAERERPALVLIDIGLPKLDGLGATRRLRECAGLVGVRIVGVSGYAAATDRAQALAAGCDGYLIKPFTSVQLYALLDQFLPPPRAAR